MEPIRTYLRPPPDGSLPQEAGQLEYSSRSLVFPRDGAGLLRAWGDPDDPYILRVEPAGARWRITGYGTDAPTARAAVRTMFSLDDPIDEFYRLVRREPVLSGADRRFRGLRVPRDPSVYESLVHAIIGQQLSVAVAATMERRLVAETGSHRTVEGVGVPFVPGPRALLGLAEEALARIGLSRVKQRALRELATEARAGRLPSAEELRSGPCDAAIERLTGLYGVGRWTAENALLRGAGRRDVFLAGDLGIRAALAAYGAVGLRASEARARTWAERAYPGWGSYATLYLWRTWIADGTPRATAPPRPTGRRPAVGARRRPG